MSFDVIGKSYPRLDAVAKVTGKAKYADDFFERDMLVGKVLRSPHAHARILSINTEKALTLDGVEAVLTHENTSRLKYPTAGHPWSLDPSHRDVEDRRIITDKARFVGDVVAAVVAKDEIIAKKALKLIEIEYEVLDFVLDPEKSFLEGAPVIHEERPNNIISSFGYSFGEIEEIKKNAGMVFSNTYRTDIVQHCQIENQTAYAYVDTDGRIVIVSSTQIPHICRRIVGQALGLSWGRIRVIKPYLGGGFGNKQDVVVEPLTAAMSLAVGGRPVRFAIDREETFIDTRTRHAMRISFEAALEADGKLRGLDINLVSNNGAYASHGHSVTMAAGSKFRPLYHWDSIRFTPKTVYTNLPVGGAMRGYGVPQMAFCLESMMDDIALKLQMDPIEFRTKNLISLGYADPMNGNQALSFGVPEVIEKGKELIQWDEKRKKYGSAEYIKSCGHNRRGVGMALFSYGSGTHPVGLELAGARIEMNQDGSVQLQIGATEIGQGSDTAFAQMVAEVIGIPFDMVHVISTQDTDISPFDTGAYASRQTYVTGFAVNKAAEEIREKALKIAARKFQKPMDSLDIANCQIVELESGTVLCPLETIAMESYYDRIHAEPITSDVSHNTRTNAFSYGGTFVEVEVDMRTGRIEVIELFNVHDSGKIINPMLAEGQVHGGVSMALGFALSEVMLFDEKTGRPLNNNLLDYKLPTALDTPDIGSVFIETDDPTSSFGQKSLGEPPTCSPAPAIRNAVLHATGLHFDKLPMTPQIVFEKLKESGMLLK